MANTTERDAHVAHSALSGLFPSRLLGMAAPTGRHLAPREPGRLVRSLFTTVPIVLVGSLAMAGLNLAGAGDLANAKRTPKPKTETSDLGLAIKAALAAATARATVGTQTSDSARTLPDSELNTASVPSTYRVKGGDTVSGIASRYHLSTASVLALNGLSWKSLIFPGQVLKLSKTGTAARVTVEAVTTVTTVTKKSTRYTIRRGDTISSIAKKFGVSTQSVLNANGLGWSSIIYPGHSIVIPGKKSATPSVPPATPPVTPPDTTPDTPPATPPSAPPASSTSGRYTIKSGDTITSIAHKFKVSISALLAANGLTISSTIYAGRTLKIPGISVASTGSTITPLSPEMRTNATTIVRVGQSLGVPDYGIIIALAAAAQESGLRDLTYGDKDSVGLFQQRPSTGWGTKTQLLDTTYASKLFYGGPHNPNKGKTRGLLDIAGWQSMTVTQAAQRVQISAYPDAYAKWETSARAWFADLK